MELSASIKYFHIYANNTNIFYFISAADLKLTDVGFSTEADQLGIIKLTMHAGVFSDKNGEIEAYAVYVTDSSDVG